MKSLLKELIFDKEIVNRLKEEKMDSNALYNLLYNGKITMQEYLKAAR